MKKILSIILSFLFLFIISISFVSNVSANCSFNGGSISDSLKNCYSNSKVVGKNSSENLKIHEKGFQNKIKDWRDILAILLGIGAVFGLVFSAFTLATSAGNEEKINKAKNIAKWSILGFFAIIFSAAIITFVVRLFYTI